MVASSKSIGIIKRESTGKRSTGKGSRKETKRVGREVVEAEGVGKEKAEGVGREKAEGVRRKKAGERGRKAEIGRQNEHPNRGSHDGKLLDYLRTSCQLHFDPSDHLHGN